MNTTPKIDFAVGGQAVIEGVMMRSPNSIVISARRPDKSIAVQEKFYQTLTQKYKIFNLPIIRGMLNLIEMMVIGSKAINFSASVSMDEVKPKKKTKKQSILQKTIEAMMFVFSLLIALALSLFLFKFLPLWITTVIEKYSSTIKENYIIFNLIDGVLKTFFFIMYIYTLSLLPSFKRIFEYHGAEHKAVFTYEKGLDLTVTNAAKQSRFHPRCGTSFILIVFVISILVYTFIPRNPDFTKNLLIRLAFLPVIAGISYEYLKISARYADKAWTRIFVAPGLCMQRLTTREPDETQLEVALHSLKLALRKEQQLAKKKLTNTKFKKTTKTGKEYTQENNVHLHSKTQKRRVV